LIKKYKYSYK